MYEGFSGQARKAIQLASEEARRRRHDHVGTEHVLFGVLREGPSGVVALLAAAGVEAEAVYRALEPALAPGQAGVTWERLPLTPAAKRALEAARQEAAALGHPCIGPEDLLLGLLRDPDGSAAQALLALGLTAEGLRANAAKLPAPENRDWMLRPEPTPGAAVRGDPSADDLAGQVSEEVLPPQRASEDVQHPSPGRRPRKSERSDALLTDAALDLPVVANQLRLLQFLVACVVGAVAGAVTLGALWAMLGWVLGCGVAATRSGIVGGIAGAAAGAVIGWTLSYADPVCYLSGGLAGAALGVLLGDWRRLPAPPGSGQGPPTREVFDNDME
jgi:hypothetical protein